MVSHSFNFEGGDQLARMGAAWFVSFAYHDYVDEGHDNWMGVSTVNLRQSVYNSTRFFHEDWLEEVVYNMSEEKLSKNSIGLHGAEIVCMAKDVLGVMRRV